MTLFVLMTRPAYHQNGILGGNGIGVTRAIQRALMTVEAEAGPVEIHGFAGNDFLADLGAAAPGMGASCHVIGCEGVTRIDRIVSHGDGSEHVDKNFRADSYFVRLQDFRRMIDQLKARLRRGDVLLITGSRPSWDFADFGVDWDAVTAELYVGMIEWAHEHGVFVALDAPPRNPDEVDAPPGPLELVFASHVRPDLAKMNSKEWTAVAAQYLAHHREFADLIAHLGVDSPQWRLAVAERLMPEGFLVVSFKKNIFAYLQRRGFLYTLDAPSKYAKRWVTSVGRGDTVMGTILALLGHRKGVLWALKRALASRLAQTFCLTPGAYAIEDALKLKEFVILEEIAKVELGQSVPA